MLHPSVEREAPSLAQHMHMVKQQRNCLPTHHDGRSRGRTNGLDVEPFKYWTTLRQSCNHTRRGFIKLAQETQSVHIWVHNNYCHYHTFLPSILTVGNSLSWYDTSAQPTSSSTISTTWGYEPKQLSVSTLHSQHHSPSPPPLPQVSLPQKTMCAAWDSTTQICRLWVRDGPSKKMTSATHKKMTSTLPR